MEGKKFQRKIENFVCGNCGAKNEGSGYTDHCFKCLWSQHVDIHPGDRQAVCEGLMKPIRAEKDGEGYLIYYKCQRCGYEHRVKSHFKDDFEGILKLMS
jgi:hypothetical protein